MYKNYKCKNKRIGSLLTLLVYYRKDVIGSLLILLVYYRKDVSIFTNQYSTYWVSSDAVVVARVALLLLL